MSYDERPKDYAMESFRMTAQRTLDNKYYEGYGHGLLLAACLGFGILTFVIGWDLLMDWLHY